MKKLLIPAAIFALGFLSSCKDAETKEPNKNESAVQEIYKGFTTGDMALFDKNIASDMVDHNGGPDGGEFKGLDNLKKMAAQMRTSIPDLKMETISQAAEGNTVFTLVKMTGTTSANPDPAMHMPPNMKINTTSVDVVKFNSEGKATDHWGYMDPKDMMAMMPPPMDTSSMMKPAMDSAHKK